MKINKIAPYILTTIFLITTISFAIPLSSSQTSTQTAPSIPPPYKAVKTYLAAGNHTLSPYYVLYYSSSQLLTGILWGQTFINDANHLLKLMVMTEENFNSFMNGSNYSVISYKSNVHIGNISFSISAPLGTIYYVWYNANPNTLQFEYVLDTEPLDFPYYAGHDYIENGLSLEPGQYYWRSISGFSYNSELSGRFQGYVNNSDCVDFFICDSLDFEQWQSTFVVPSGAFWKALDVSHVSWSVNLPYINTWYVVISAINSPKPVTFSVYIDIEEAATPDYFEITHPSAGERWALGTGRYVTWNSYVSVAEIDLWLCKGNLSNFLGYIVFDWPNNGQYLWSIPDYLEPGDDYILGVSDAHNGSTYSVSAPFSLIEKREIIITSPTGDTVWQAGTLQQITWSYTGDFDEVEIGLSKGTPDNILGLISESAPNTGSYTWGIPDYLDPGTDYYIYIASLPDYSVLNFTLEPLNK